MEETFFSRLARRLSPVLNLLDRIGYVWVWLALSLILLSIVVWLNPVRLGSYLWFASKLAGAFALGYGFDVAAFRSADPRYLDGIERAMASR